METRRDDSQDISVDAPETIHIRVSPPKGAPIAEFDKPMTDAIEHVGAIDHKADARLAACP